MQKHYFAAQIPDPTLATGDLTTASTSISAAATAGGTASIQPTYITI